MFGEEGLPQSSFLATTGKTWPHVASIYSLTLFFSQFQGSSLPKPSCVCLLPCLIIFWRYANYASQQPCHILRKISLLPSTSVLKSQHQHLTETFFCGGKKSGRWNSHWSSQELMHSGKWVKMLKELGLIPGRASDRAHAPKGHRHRNGGGLVSWIGCGDGHPFLIDGR